MINEILEKEYKEYNIINKIFEILKKEYIKYEYSYSIRGSQLDYNITFKLNSKWFKIYNILKCNIDCNYFSLLINDDATIHILISYINNKDNFWNINFNCRTTISLYDTNFDNLYHIINDDNPIELIQRIQLKNKIRKII
jgi:hypothetical protein